MTSNIGIFGKRVHQSVRNKFRTTLKPSTLSQQELQEQIDSFFSSSNDQQLKTQLDDLIKKDEKTKSDKKVDSNRMLDFLSLSKNKKPLTISDKFKPSKVKAKNESNKKVKQEEFKEETVEANTEKEKNEETKAQEEQADETTPETQNDWVKELDTLNEELDIGEQLISKNEPASIGLNKTKISETLAELIVDNKDNGQVESHLESTKSLNINANAQRQNIAQPQGQGQTQQSSSSGKI